VELTREQALTYRVVAQQLDGEPRGLDEVAVLDLGVQDTGADGAAWALALRGGTFSTDQLVLAWTLRGAPHYYRRKEIAQVAAATAPFSEADAAKRVFDAAKPLRDAGIPVLDALDRVASEMRSTVTRPTAKGDLSTALTARLPAAFVRYCRVCRATHSYEQTFRLSALRGGLELEPKTSPPVLRRIPGWRTVAKRVPARLDVVRAYLHLLGPATPNAVAGYVDAPLKEVKTRWPVDAVEVTVDGRRRWALEGDLPLLAEGEADVDPHRVRLLASFDMFLQAKDRELVLPDAARRKQLWVMLGRPGGVLRGAEVAGIWRPRVRGRRLALAVEEWLPVERAALEAEGERLAAHRGLEFAGIDPLDG
jgi:hypothetical protein